jgi:DNA-binding GntR family transcriptional regulator
VTRSNLYGKPYRRGSHLSSGKDEIRGLILSDRIRPGTRLVEKQPAMEFGVSRNLIREAIRALASKGLIEISSG